MELYDDAASGEVNVVLGADSTNFFTNLLGNTHSMTLKSSTDTLDPSEFLSRSRRVTSLSSSSVTLPKVKASGRCVSVTYDGETLDSYFCLHMTDNFLLLSAKLTNDEDVLFDTGLSLQTSSNEVTAYVWGELDGLIDNSANLTVEGGTVSLRGNIGENSIDAMWDNRNLFINANLPSANVALNSVLKGGHLDIAACAFGGCSNISGLFPSRYMNIRSLVSP